MKFRLRIDVVVVAMLALVVAGCGGAGGHGEDEDSAAAPSTAVVMSVTAAKATVAPMRDELRLLGVTAALKHVTLRAPAQGRVLGLKLESGDRVRRGEVIAHIMNRETEAAESGLAVARRLDPSHAPRLAQSVNRYVETSGIPIVAHDDGVVAQRLVSSGQIVADLDPLVELVDPRSLYIDAAVPIGDLAKIKLGMDAVVTSPLEPNLEFPARVVALSPSLSPGGVSTPARIEFTGAGRIEQVGAPVEVRVTIAYAPRAIVIPAAALFQDAAGASYVFIAGTDGRAHRTPVTIAIRTRERVQVVTGITPGQQVITSGGYALSDGLKVSVAVARD